MASRGANRVGSVVGLGLVAVLMAVAGLLPPDPVGAGTGVRYLDPVFSDVVVTPDQHFRTANDCTNSPVDLYLDLYEPQGDTEEARPLYVWIHGGSFSWGDKDGPLEVAVAQDFARRGYVVASIEYRLCPSLTFDVINDAGEDAAAAVAYLRGRAAELRIDPDRIAVGGASAGAITATLVGYAPDRSLGEGGPEDPGHADAIVSIAGAGLPNQPESDEPPIFMAHGTDDPIIPISAALEFCAAVEAAGPGCEFHEYPAGHEDLVVFFDDIEAVLFPWLYDVLDLAPPPPVDPDPTGTTTTTGPPTTTTEPPDAASVRSPAPASTTAVATPVGSSPALTG